MSAIHIQYYKTLKFSAENSKNRKLWHKELD